MLEFIIQSYANYTILYIILETIATITGIISVLYCSKQNILVYPTGIISTMIYTFLLFFWELYGDMVLNAYYVVVSVVGWVWWKGKLKENDTRHVYIARMDLRIFIVSVVTFIFAMIFIAYVYLYFMHASSESIFDLPSYAYLDILTSSIAFTSMYLMNKRITASWYLWMVFNLLSMVLYVYREHLITVIQFFVFFTINIFALFQWKKKGMYEKQNKGEN